MLLSTPSFVSNLMSTPSGLMMFEFASLGLAGLYLQNIRSHVSEFFPRVSVVS